MIRSAHFHWPMFTVLLALAQTTPEVSRAVDNPTAQQLTQAAEFLDHGEKLLLEDRYAEASTYFARAVTLDPHDPRSRLFLGFTEFAVGQFEDAATTVHDLMKRAPDLAANPIDMHGSFSDIQVIETQLLKLENIASLQPESSRMHFLLGFVRYYTGDRASGAQTLLEYSAANPDDLTIQPFIAIAGNSIQPLPQPERRPVAKQSIRPPSAKPIAPPGSGFQNRPPPPIEPRRQIPAYGRRPAEQVERRSCSRPDLQGSVDVVEPPRRNPEVVPPAPEGESLTDLAIIEFCHEHGLDPINNHVVAMLTDEYFDDDTGTLAKAKFKVRWVEWKHKEGRHGRPVRKEKQKSETIKLQFDERGRLIDYDD